jgi:2-octaprenylphenol hydroxylase
MKPDFDVLVVGGGMVGAGFAALLGAYEPTASLKVAMLEPRPVPYPAAGEPLDLRVSALSRASQRLLERAGAWPRVVERGASPYQRMIVWDEKSLPEASDSIRFDAADLGEPDLGHIVENHAVQAALIERATAHGVTLLRSGIGELSPAVDSISVVTTEGRKLSAALVVAADGGESAVRRLAGIDSRSWDYGQHAVVAHLQPERGHARTAWQRFLASGPLALLPLADGRVSLVWSTTPERAAALIELDDTAFGEQVTAASGAVLGPLQPTTRRVAFPLRLLHALSYTGKRVALIGDAAHGVHPLAGQGVNLGFMDAAALAQTLGEGLEGGADPGDAAPLRRYERWRKAENLPAMALMDGLKRLFSNDDPVLSWVRRSGLALADRSGPLKRSLIEHAMGLVGEVPRPARGQFVFSPPARRSRPLRG